MGEGSWDSYGSRVVLHVNNFTINEVKLIQNILLSKFNISNYLVKTNKTDLLRGYLIKIPKREVDKIRALTKEYIYPSLLYKIGL